MNYLSIIFNIFIGFSIRRLMIREPLNDWKWFSFVMLITASFIIIDYLPIEKIEEKFSERQYRNTLEVENPEPDKVIPTKASWWIKTILRNGAIVMASGMSA